MKYVPIYFLQLNTILLFLPTLYVWNLEFCHMTLAIINLCVTSHELGTRTRPTLQLAQ